MRSAFGVEHIIAKGGAINPVAVHGVTKPLSQLGRRLQAERAAAGKRPGKLRFQAQDVNRINRKK